jgi:glycogen synthase
VKILSVGNMYPPHSLGGYEEVWRGATLHLRERGHQVRVLTTDYRRRDGAGGAESDVHRELRWYWRDHRFPRIGPAGILSLERHNRRALDRHLRQFAPEVVSWWGMGGMSLSLLDRVHPVPTVAFVHEDWLVYGPRVDRWTRVRSRLGRGFRPNPGSAWVFNSEHTRRVALSVHPYLDHTGVAYPGVNASLFRPAPAHPWRWRLLYVGRLDPRKGVEVGIEALTHLPSEATLTIIGDGDDAYASELRRLVERHGLAGRVGFLGRRPRAELPVIYAAADAVLFPVTWEEPFGLVPLEAMAVGRPVVATGRGGAAEYLRDRENCLLFDTGDASSLAAAVHRLAADERLRARLRESGAETAARYDEASFNQSVEDWLRASAGSGSSPASPLAGPPSRR